MAPKSTEPMTLERNPISESSTQFIKRHELIALLIALSKSQTSIRIKRIDRVNYGNFSTVVRASGALIMTREIHDGPAEVIPDLRDIQQFELNEDFLNFKGHTQYEVI